MFQLRPEGTGSGVGLGVGAGVGVGTGVGLGVGTGVGEGVGTGVDVVEGSEVGVWAGKVDAEVAVGVGARGTAVAVGAGSGDGLDSCVINSSSITADISSKEGDPSNFVPVLLGSVDRTKMVGVTETSFRRARFMSL